jgi:predicted  nucleic acid-binding Zn-ribbon protein
MHRLVEELRAREQYLEEHSEHPIFDNDESGEYKRDYDKLVAELKAFNDRVVKAQEKGESFDEHFEREIKDEHNHLKVKVESWSKKLDS